MIYIAAIADNAGATIAINSYDDWGIPAPANLGRFQYTGQAWIPQLGMYHYKARMYSPTLGRFMQTDPIGYEDGMNMYAYVGNDPVNGVDPTGMNRCAFKTCDSSGVEGMDAVQTGSRSSSLGESLARTQGQRGPQQYNSNNVEAGGNGSDSGGEAEDFNSSILNNVMGCESGMTCAIARDERSVLNNEISQDEFNARNNARGIGVAVGSAGLAAGVAAVEAAPVVAAVTGRVAQSALRRNGPLNRNGYVRVGESWRGTRSAGQRVFRISIGRQRPYRIFGRRIRIHEHIDLGRWPW